MKKFSEFITEENIKTNKKLWFNGSNDKYKMLDKANVEILSTGKSTSKVKIIDLSDTDLYRPKTDTISKSQLKNSVDKTYLNKTFSIKNKFIVSK